MGNRALRKKAAAALRAGGYPFKLYRGKGFRYQHSANTLRLIARYAALKVGDVVHDCDGFNHVVANQTESHKFPALFFRSLSWELRRKGYVAVCDLQLKWDDTQDTPGCFSCGCYAGFRPAWSREDVEARFVSFWEAYNKTWANEPWQKEAVLVLKSGGHICDERGVLFPEWIAKKSVRSVDSQKQIL